MCDVKEEFRDTDGLVEEWTGGSLRCRSPPGAKPFCLCVGERSRPSGLATFLNVIVHSMSSPANTMASFHCTNTRIFEEDIVRAVDDAGCVLGGGSSGALAKRHDACHMGVANRELRSQLGVERFDATRVGGVFGL